MKLKEIDRNGNITWSPKSLDKSYLVVGTASQQLDTSFSTKSQLEIFEYIPNEKGFEMPVVSSIIADTKFSKLLWGNVADNKGVIVGGSESGTISIYDSAELLNQRKSSVEPFSEIAVKRDHKGPVHAMDFNKFKPNLLATGGAESDIFIWDLDKFDEPMTPGNKSQPFEEIRSLSWNNKVQHILGSTSTHRCQIWDLRKSDPVIKLSDTQMKMKCNKLVWHPEISTRLCISSADDHTPVIQLWDLRYIQCPFHTLQRHTKGIVDLEWNIDDADILMSIGRDRQMICWNMSPHNTSTKVDTSTEVIYEWQLDQDMINEAHFCPKHPGLVSVSSFDCHISLYSLMGGRGHVSRELSDTVIESFPLELNEAENDEIERMKIEAEKAAELQLSPTPCLSKAPKWLKRPCGASFAFGGKLIQFCKMESSRSRNNSVSQTGSISATDNSYKIIISQVRTNNELVESSVALENAIQGQDSLLYYCHEKIQSVSNQIHETHNEKLKSDCVFDLNIWKFIECHFYEDSRSAFMQNLGYNNANKSAEYGSLTVNEAHVTERKENSSDNLIFHSENTELSLDNIQLLPSFEGSEKSLSVALMTGDIESAVNICLQENRLGEAAVLAVSSARQDLFEKVQNDIFYKSQNQSLTTSLIYIAVKRNWLELVNKCDLNHWKEALAWLLTYAGTEELSDLCGTLGHRLEERAMREANNSLFSLSACICYICSGSINEFVRCWLNFNSLKCIKDLQTLANLVLEYMGNLFHVKCLGTVATHANKIMRLIEIIVLLCKSIGDDDFSLIKDDTAEIFKNYASLLTSQGSLATALKYLGNNDDKKLLILRHRICEQLRNRLPSGVSAPKSPFVVTPILKPLSQQKYKSHPKVQVSSFTENSKLINQIPSGFPPSTVQQHHSMPKLPVTPKPLIQNQFNLEHIPNLPPVSTNNPLNYYSSQYPTHSSGVPLSQLPFIPNNSQPPPQLPINNIMQQSNHHFNKSAWNDPPLLSENYRSDINKDEIKLQPKFFNPTASITDISDVNYLGSKMSATGVNSDNVSTNFENLPKVNLSSDSNSPMKTRASNSFNSESSSSRCQDLSPEIRHVQAVLLNLVEKCRQRDQSRQIKIKMDDIQKKINNMFDILKTQSLSPELTNGLLNLIAILENNCYRQSFDEVNNIIQTVNFSEAGIFLPSVKMLIQCAIKIFE